MKKPARHSIAALVVSFLFFSCASYLNAHSMDEVNTSRHNLLPPSALSSSTSCALCHIDGIPWKSSAEKEAAQQSASQKPALSPLWISKGAKPYSLTANLSLDRQPYNQPTGSSLTCLACHDGALGKDMHGINVGPSRLGAEGNLPSKPNIGHLGAPALSRVDHPISVTYPRKVSGRFDPENPTVTYARYWTIPDLGPDGFVLPKEGSSSYLDLPADGKASPEAVSALVRTTSGVVQCDSCHNPHSEKVRPFLRVPSASLCLICHNR